MVKYWLGTIFHPLIKWDSDMCQLTCSRLRLQQSAECQYTANMQSMSRIRSYIVRVQFREMLGPIYVMMMHLCSVAVGAVWILFLKGCAPSLHHSPILQVKSSDMIKMHTSLDWSSNSFCVLRLYARNAEIIAHHCHKNVYLLVPQIG